MKPVRTFLLLILFCGGISHAQRNYKFENFGNRSVLLNGNVTGSVDDLGATYYNPARLALVEDPVFLINAKIYQLSNLKLDNVTIEGKNISKTNFDGVPSMLAGSFKIKKLPGHSFAYSTFSRNRSDLSLNYNSDLVDAGIGSEIGKYISSTDVKNKLRESWFGSSWATSLSSNFSIGVSLFVSYYKFEIGKTEKLNIINEQNVVSNYYSNIFLQQKSYGLFGKIGAAWTLPKFDLGVNVDLPYLEVFNDAKFQYEEYASGFESVNDIFTYNNFDNLDSERKYPLGISVGAGIPVRKHKLHFDVSWHAKINEYKKIDIPNLNSETEDNLPELTFNEKLKSTVNFGIGTEIYISEKVNLYGSYSTDFSPYRKAKDDPTEQVVNTTSISTNYNHFGLGTNVSHKWANFILGAIYSTGNSKLPRNQIPIIPSNTSDFSNLRVNRWRFVVGIEILFIDNSKLSKFGLDNKLF